MHTPLRVAVVGSGIVGTLTALQLQQHHHQVTLIERDVDGLCCSTGNAGSISASSVAPVGMPGIWKQVPSMLLNPDGALCIDPRYALHIAPWLYAFLKAATPARVQAIAQALHQLSSPAVQHYQHILGRLGASDLMTTMGQLHVYSSLAARNKDASGWQLRRTHGADVQFLDSHALHALEPDVSPLFTHGVYIHSDGHIIHPQRLLQTLRQALVQGGGHLESANVQRVVPAGSQVQVHTTQSVRTFDKAVIAAGAWSAQLSDLLGDPVPLQTQRGYHAVIAHAGVHIQRPVVAAEAKVFATPMEMGLRFAGTVEFAQLDRPATPSRVQSLVRHGMRLFPGIPPEAAAQHTHWMGNRPCLPDSVPVIGHASASPHIIYAFGHGHLGLTHAPQTAHMVQQLLHMHSAPGDWCAFSAQRFRAAGSVH